MPDYRTYTWKDKVTPSKPKKPYINPVVIPITISGNSQFEYPHIFKLPEIDLSMKPVLDAETGKLSNGVVDNVAYSLNKNEQLVVKRYSVEGHPNQFIVANIAIDPHIGEVTVGMYFDPSIELKEQQLLIPVNINIHNGNGTTVQEVVMVINAEGNIPNLNFNREMSPTPSEKPPYYVKQAENSINIEDYNLNK